MQNLRTGIEYASRQLIICQCFLLVKAPYITISIVVQLKKNSMREVKNLTPILVNDCNPTT